jgi:hypothetical protein
MRMRELIDLVESANKNLWRSGETAYYEYHCNRSHDSEDAPLWYRSHQPVEVVAIADRGYGRTLDQRLNNSQPHTYEVLFPDGFVGHAFEDELFTGPEHLDPAGGPPPPEEIEAHRPLTESRGTTNYFTGTGTTSATISGGYVQMYPHNDGWTITVLWAVEPGGGRRAMEALCREADAKGIRLDLSAYPQHAAKHAGVKMTKTELKDWYKQFGFRGTCRLMVRQPNRTISESVDVPEAVVEQYSYGDCMWLALAMHKRFGWPIRCQMHRDDEHGDYVAHAYCVMPDGREVDILGPQKQVDIWTQNVEEWEADELLATMSYDAVEAKRKLEQATRAMDCYILPKL